MVVLRTVPLTQSFISASSPTPTALQITWCDVLPRQNSIDLHGTSNGAEPERIHHLSEDDDHGDEAAK